VLTVTRAGRPRRRRSDVHGEGLFVVEAKRGRRWTARSTLRSERTALNSARELLTREGGEVRVRQGRRMVAEGVACDPNGRGDP
jgi:hypothetical protein